MTDDLKKTYRGNVMIEVITVPSVDAPNVRKTRSLKAVDPPTDVSISFCL